jgi:hypothetical protein
VRLLVAATAFVLLTTGVYDVVELYLSGALLGIGASFRGFYRSAYALGVTDALGQGELERVYALGRLRRSAVALVISFGFAVAGLAALAFQIDPGPTIGRIANDLLQVGIVGAVWLIALLADLEDESTERLAEGK